MLLLALARDFETLVFNINFVQYGVALISVQFSFPEVNQYFVFVLICYPCVILMSDRFKYFVPSRYFRL